MRKREGTRSEYRDSESDQGFLIYKKLLEPLFTMNPYTNPSTTSAYRPEGSRIACVGLQGVRVGSDSPIISQGVYDALRDDLAHMSSKLGMTDLLSVGVGVPSLDQSREFRSIGSSFLFDLTSSYLVISYRSSLLFRVIEGFRVDQSLTNTKTQNTHTNKNTNTYPSSNINNNHYHTHADTSTTSTHHHPDTDSNTQTKTSTNFIHVRENQTWKKVCISKVKQPSLIYGRRGVAPPLCLKEVCFNLELVHACLPVQTSCSDVWEEQAHLSPGTNNNLRAKDVRLITGPELYMIVGSVLTFWLSYAGQILFLGIGISKNISAIPDPHTEDGAGVKKSIRKMLSLNLKLSHDGLHSVMGKRNGSHYGYSV